VLVRKTPIKKREIVVNIRSTKIFD